MVSATTVTWILEKTVKIGRGGESLRDDDGDRELRDAVTIRVRHRVRPAQLDPEVVAAAASHRLTYSDPVQP